MFLQSKQAALVCHAHEDNLVCHFAYISITRQSWCIRLADTIRCYNQQAMGIQQFLQVRRNNLIHLPGHYQYDGTFSTFQKMEYILLQFRTESTDYTLMTAMISRSPVIELTGGLTPCEPSTMSSSVLVCGGAWWQPLQLASNALWRTINTNKNSLFIL